MPKKNNQFQTGGLDPVSFRRSHLGTWAQLSGFSNVASLAHLGGAGVGLVFWLVTRKD